VKKRKLELPYLVKVGQSVLVVCGVGLYPYLSQSWPSFTPTFGEVIADYRYSLILVGALNLFFSCNKHAAHSRSVWP